MQVSRVQDAEANTQLYLVPGHLPVLDISPNLFDLKPVQFLKRLPSPGDRPFDGQEIGILSPRVYSRPGNCSDLMRRTRFAPTVSYLVRWPFRSESPQNSPKLNSYIR